VLRAARSEVLSLRVLLLTALALTALIVAAPWLYPYFELPALRYEVKGVDVSHYQGNVDWPALRKSGVRFAYIKATEGASLRDPRFAENWQRSYDAGIAHGAYHYFSLCISGAEQVTNFIATTPADIGSLPHALDVEQMEPCTKGRRSADPLAEIGTFLDAAEKHFGRRPLIYTTQEFYEAYFRDGRSAERLGKEHFWLRSLHRAPSYGRWILWQYHNRGRRAGIDGPVDLNAFNGSMEEFEKFVAPQLFQRFSNVFRD
jgi:lysozyme